MLAILFAATFHHALAAPPPPPLPLSPAPSRGACPLTGMNPDVLFGADERGLSPSLLPMIGNGYVATQIDGASLFVAGAYTGAARQALGPRCRCRRRGR